MSRKSQHDDWPAERIQDLREKLSLTQKQLAAFLRVDCSAVAHWERGHHSPNGTVQMVLDMLIAGYYSRLPVGLSVSCPEMELVATADRETL